jgi:hypothetical protein
MREARLMGMELTKSRWVRRRCLWKLGQTVTRVFLHGGLSERGGRTELEQTVLRVLHHGGLSERGGRTEL